MKDMQQTINRVVEEFLSGREAVASGLYESLLFDSQGGVPEEFEFCGTVIPEQCLEYSAENYELLEVFVTDDRLTELSNGAEATGEETKEYRRRILAPVEDGSADADVMPGYWVRCLRHSDGREAFALETVKGYSFSGVTNTFHGIFPKLKEALKELSTWGVVVQGMRKHSRTSRSRW
jgi:hypothetical protein